MVGSFGNIRFSFATGEYYIFVDKPDLDKVVIGCNDIQVRLSDIINKNVPQPGDCRTKDEK